MRAWDRGLLARPSLQPGLATHPCSAGRRVGSAGTAPPRRARGRHPVACPFRGFGAEPPSSVSARASSANGLDGWGFAGSPRSPRQGWRQAPALRSAPPLGSVQVPSATPALAPTPPPDSLRPRAGKAVAGAAGRARSPHPPGPHPPDPHLCSDPRLAPGPRLPQHWGAGRAVTQRRRLTCRRPARSAPVGLRARHHAPWPGVETRTWPPRRFDTRSAVG